MRKPEELLPILDEQIAFVLQKLALLEAMADCTVRADLAELERLLQGEGQLEADGAGIEGRLEGLRRALAEQAGLPAGEMTLRRLAASLDGPLALQLADRRERLALLLEAVQQQARKTASLVDHAMSLNQRMLEVLTGNSGQGGVYSAAGRLDSGTEHAILRHCV